MITFNNVGNKEQTERAIFAYIYYYMNSWLFLTKQLTIMIYGCEVWVYENVKI